MYALGGTADGAMTQYKNDRRGRLAVVEGLRGLAEHGLNRGTAGNVSVRTAAGMLITPTGLSPAELSPGHIVHMALDGSVDAQQLAPSSEWRIHADIYRGHPGVHAVVHCHSAYATMLACARRAIPAVHYMVAAAGAREIPLAGYATFGTAQLSRAAVAALADCAACLLANHGQIATAEHLPGALKLAALVEELAQCYWGTLAIGGPVILDAAQMDEVMAAFANYGQQPRHAGD